MPTNTRRPALPPPRAPGPRPRRTAPATVHGVAEQADRPAVNPASIGGRTARSLPPRPHSQAAASRKKPVHNGAGRREKTNRRFIQLIICTVVFGLALLLKTLAPESAASIKQVFADSIGGGLDYKAAFASMGQLLSSGESIVDVFKDVSTVLFGAKEEGAQASPPGASALPTPEQLPSTAQKPTDTPEPDQPAFSELPQDIHEMTDDTDAADTVDHSSALASRGTSFPGWRNLGDSTAGDGVIMSGWEVSLPDADTQDDTPPVPFELAVPSNVDYTEYPLDFSHVVPVSGTMTSDFGYRDHPVYGETLFHYGIDIGAASGTKIRSFADGVVTSTGLSDSYGNYVKVLHADGISTFYAHCSKILVKDGQVVEKGDAIARVGMTGTATGPHLHFEVRKGDSILDPNHYVALDPS